MPKLVFALGLMDESKKMTGCCNGWVKYRDGTSDIIPLLSMEDDEEKIIQQITQSIRELIQAKKRYEENVSNNREPT
jgi:hypothetical protein